jgi:hypothetical protein
MEEISFNDFDGKPRTGIIEKDENFWGNKQLNTTIAFYH